MENGVSIRLMFADPTGVIFLISFSPMLGGSFQVCWSTTLFCHSHMVEAVLKVSILSVLFFFSVGNNDIESIPPYVRCSLY